MEIQEHRRIDSMTKEVQSVGLGCFRDELSRALPLPPYVIGLATEQKGKGGLAQRQRERERKGGERVRKTETAGYVGTQVSSIDSHMHYKQEIKHLLHIP